MALTRKQILRELERALAPLERIQEALGDEWDDYENDDIARAASAIREACSNRDERRVP